MGGISERNPFVGPRPIQQGESLYGRDAEVRELYNRLQARRILVLHSPSGAGKSSLVQAGLIPRLAEGGYDVWKPIRVNLDPDGLEGIPAGTNRYLLSALVSLEDELPAAHRRSPAELAGLDFCEYVERRPRRKGRGNLPVVLIFDQFEEVLTVAPLAVDAKRAFFAAVGRALETETCWALFLIREDHLAAFAPYRDRVPTQMSNTFRLDLLGLAGAREAAKKLAEQGGRSFPAVDQLVRDLSRVQVQQADGSFVAEQGLYVEPVHLQVVCRRLWDAMPAEDLSIDAEDIAAYASVSQALGGYYADTVRAISGGDDAVERALREWVGHKLIVGGIRSQVRQEAGKTAGLDNRLILRLLDSYLVRTEPRAGAHWFELSHDRLVEPVQLDNNAWEQAHLHSLQVQAKLWEDARRSGALLLSAQALPDAQAWAKHHPALLTEGEQEFLQQSRELRARERAARRRLNALTAIAGLVAVVVGSLGVVAWMARGRALAAEAAAVAAGLDTSRALERARDASLMAGARELKAGGQTALATRLLLEVKEPGAVRGWHEVARETLASPVQYLTLRGTMKGVLSAVWSPDGKHILTVSRDGAARVWDAGAPGEAVVLRGHAEEVSAAAWSRDGRRVVNAYADGTLRVWNADGEGEAVVLRGHEGPITSLAWSPDGQRIFTASRDRTARAWRADGTGEPSVVRGPPPFRLASWSPDGQRIAALSDVDGLHVLSTRGMPVRVVEDRKFPITSMTWSPDGQRLLVTIRYHAALVWSAEANSAPLVLKKHEAVVRFGAWSPDGEQILTVSEDQTLRVGDAGGEGELAVLRHEGMVVSAAWSPDGQRILVVSDDRTVRVWNSDGSGEPVVLRGLAEPIERAAWSPDGHRILMVSGDTVRVWKVDGIVVGHEVTSVAWSPDGQRIATRGWGRTVQVWSADGTGEVVLGQVEGDPSRPLRNITRAVPQLRGRHSRDARSLVWSSDGRRIALSVGWMVRVWDTAGAGEAVVFGGPGDEVDSMAWSPDGQRIVLVSRDRVARISRADGSGEALVLKGHEHQIDSATWSPDGQRILATSLDSTARVWNADGEGEPIVLGGSMNRVDTAVWSPEGRRIAGVSLGDAVRIWQADGSGEALVLGGQELAIVSAAWSPDGQRILTTSWDPTVRVWSADGKGEPVVLSGHKDAVHFAAWSPDGRRILTTSEDQTARVWNADGTGKPVVLGGHGGAPLSAEWSPDGQRILTVSRLVRVWAADGTGEPLIVRAVNTSAAAWSPDGHSIHTISGAGAGTVQIWGMTTSALQRSLRSATSDCLPPEMRLTYLDEREAASRAGYEACERQYGRMSTDSEPKADAATALVAVDPGAPDGDACSSGGCVVAPTGVILTPGVLTAQAGNVNGGSEFNAPCAAGQALIGFAGAYNLYHRQIHGVCGLLALTPVAGGFAVNLTDPVALPYPGNLPESGEFGHNEWARTCPKDQVIVGFSGRKGDLVDSLTFTCAALVVREVKDGAWAIAVGGRANLDPVGGNGGEPFPRADCPAGQVGTMQRLRSGNALDAFGIGCSAVGLAGGVSAADH